MIFVRRAALWAGLLLGALASPALAQVTPERCALIGGATERLACYDSIFRTDTPPAGQEAEAINLWTTGIEISEIDGTETVYATIPSEQLIPARPTGRALARMTVLCTNEVTTLQFTFAGQFMGTENSNSAPITTQFDRNPPQTQSQPLSQDRTAIGFFQSAQAIGFAGQLMDAERLLVRATPLGQRSVTVSFVLEGIAEALAPVAEACGW